MTVTLKAQFVRSIPSDGVFTVNIDIIDVQNIDFDVLVFDTETSAFSHVASVFDLETYPVGVTAAAAGNLAFYRARGAVVSFNSPLDATTFETVTNSRLTLLAGAWNVIITDFTGSDIVDITSV